MIQEDIFKQINIIEEALAWSKKYGKDLFPRDIFKDHRRKLKKIRFALEEKCSAAAYGESQVGKSYLMSSLLSSPDTPFEITNGGKSYSFIDQLNPSGGNMSKNESTGVITRFTAQDANNVMQNYIKVRNLSIVDIILLIVDSYYNDVKINPENALRYDVINAELRDNYSSWMKTEFIQFDIMEDDIRDIQDYIKEIIGNNAANVISSDFFEILAPVIQHVPYEKWSDIFGLLWNRNVDLNLLFTKLINEYKKIKFSAEVYVPFKAVIKEKGTLLNIEWLDLVCDEEIDLRGKDRYTDVYDCKGNIIANNFEKSYLSAIIAELTFELPKTIVKDRKFLDNIDLLDFPGARSREKIKEKDIKKALPSILRRGKVAYLFNKYSRSLRISSILFCHHNDQKTEPSIGETINNWIVDNIGDSTNDRASFLKKTSGIAPLFLIATKFNIDIERTKNDCIESADKLYTHWDRFAKVLPEIIKPYTWLDKWVTQGGIFETPFFQNIYLLRDFFWSNKNRLFEGYSDGAEKSPETGICIHEDYLDYMDDLKTSFINFPFVKKHFADPAKSWDDVATINKDGSKAIIENLNKIASTLNEARQEKYLSELKEIKNDILKILELNYVSDSDESKNKKVKAITGNIRRKLYLSIGLCPEIFGSIIDQLMLPSKALRDISYDIIIRRTEVPRDFTAVNLIRATVGINPKDAKEINVKKLCEYFSSTEDELETDYNAKGFTLDDVISSETEALTTVADVVTKHIVDYWITHINQSVKKLQADLPHSDEIAFMLQTLLKILNVKKKLAKKIAHYDILFANPQDRPNAIADLASLMLNNFVSTIGCNYMKEEHLEIVSRKAKVCDIIINTSHSETILEQQPLPLLDALEALDASADIMRRGEYANNTEVMDTLRKLPFWDNFQRWENGVTVGLLLTSDVAECDPEANATVKLIIDNCNTLYNTI